MKKILVVTLVLLVLVSLLIVLIPAYLIRPFAPQTQVDLGASYTLRRLSPTITVAALLLGSSCALPLWRSERGRGRRAFLSICFVLLCTTAILSRQNHFEWMFHPLPDPGYVEATKASHVRDADMVLNLEMGGEARAYPVPLMAYHHLVNTTVGGEPIVATY